MSVIRAAAACGTAVAFAACSLMDLSDLSGGPAPDGAAPDQQSVDAAGADQESVDGGGLADAGDAASSCAALLDGSTRLKATTFEDGVLLNPVTGATTTGGAAPGVLDIESAAPITGSYSAHVRGVPEAGTAYFEDVYPPTCELFVSFRLRVQATPSAKTRLVRIGSATLPIVELRLDANGLHVNSFDTTAPFTSGTVYRVGVHILGANATDPGQVETYVALGSEPFTKPFAKTTGVNPLPTFDRIRMGQTATDFYGMDVVLDDILLDTGAMPAP